MIVHTHPARIALARGASTVLLAGVVFLAACGDSGGPSNLTAAQMADRFDRIANDYDRDGDAEAGGLLHGFAALVRVTGHLSPAEMTIDGQRSAGWYALGVQLLTPEVPCPAGAPPWCEPLPADAARLAVAWQGASAQRVLLLVADTTGSDNYEFAVEGAELELPAVGLYIDRQHEVAWLTDSGTVSSAYRRTGEPCPNDVRAPDGLEFTCARVSFDVTTGFRAYELTFDQSDPVLHRVTLSATDLAGALMTITNWGSLELPVGLRLGVSPGLARGMRR